MSAKKTTAVAVPTVQAATIYNIKEAVLTNLSQGVTPYPVETTRGMGLKRSVIPEEDIQGIKFFLDKASNLKLSSFAIANGIHTDELLRHLVWSLNL